VRARAAAAEEVALRAPQREREREREIVIEKLWTADLDRLFLVINQSRGFRFKAGDQPCASKRATYTHAV
jgi:hypothetical protein